MGGAPNRQAIGSPQVGEFESADAMYLPISESQSEDEDMCMVSNDEGLAPGPSNKISTNDWDEEQHTMLGMRAINLKTISLSPNHDAPTCVDAKNMKKESPAKKKVKRQNVPRENVNLPKHTNGWCLVTT